MKDYTNPSKSIISARFVALGLATLAIALTIPFLVDKVDNFLLQVSTRTGGHVNIYIAYALLLIAPIVPFIIWRLRPVSFIAFVIAILPLIARIKSIFGIYAYTDFNSNPVYISGLALLAPLIFAYLVLRFPHERCSIWTSSLASRSFLLLVFSGVSVQFLFFGPAEAVKVAYLNLGAQFFVYITIMSFVRSVDDVYTVLCAILIAVTISGILALLTTPKGIIPVMNSNYYTELNSNTFGQNNYYGPLLSSTLCLFPLFFSRSKRSFYIILTVLLILVCKLLLMTGNRGSFLGLAPILFVLFFVSKSKPAAIISISVCIVAIIALLLPQFITYAHHRIFTMAALGTNDVLIRFAWASATIAALMRWPAFVTGYGMCTLSNVVMSGEFPIQMVHQGFLNVWVNCGLLAFIGFVMWLVVSLCNSFKKFWLTKLYEEKLILISLVACIVSWLIAFCTVGGWYISSVTELYSIFTTEVALLSLASSHSTKSMRNTFHISGKG